MVWVVLSLVTSVSTPLFQQEKAVLEEVAVRFVQHLGEHRFDEAHAMLNAGVAGSMDALQLEHSLIAQSRGLGALVKVHSTGRIERLGSYQGVRVRLKWERGAHAIIVMVDQQSNIIGLNWVPVPSRDAPPAAPPTTTVRRLTVGKQGAQGALPAYFTFPVNGRPRAGVLMIHDFGPLDQDGAVSLHKPYLDLAAGLGAKGVASLRYAKRTHFYGTRLYKPGFLVKDEVIDDALSALAALRERKELEGKPLFILAHGMGGLVAAEIAAADGKVSGLILLGTPARPIEDVLSDIHEQLVSNFYESVRVAPAATTLALLEELRQGKLDDTKQILFAHASYWRDLCTRDAEVAVKRVAATPGRVLVLQGDRDQQANDEDFRLWQAGLSGHRDATVRRLEGLNHLFTRGKGEFTSDEYAVPREVDQGAIDLIAQWCLKSTKTAAAP